MSVYAVSDLHGYPLKWFIELLDSAGFTADDTLYIIGDVIDRNGDGGVELLRHIMAQPNYEFLLGNHEAMLLACDFLFEEVADPALARLGQLEVKALERYLRNGGGVTINSLRALHKADPAAFRELIDFLRDSPVVGSASVNGRDFLLVHGGFKDFSPDKKLADYSAYDLVWERPKLEDEYFDDIITVLGHTPTNFYGEQYKGKVLFTETWINIDTGAAYGMPPALLRLDDLKVFYGKATV